MGPSRCSSASTEDTDHHHPDDARDNVTLHLCSDAGGLAVRTSLVQPSTRRHSVSPHLLSSHPSDDSPHGKHTPRLTFSLTSSSRDGQTVLDLTLIRAEHLNRPHVSRTPGGESHGVAGLCARIYKKQMDGESDANNRQKNDCMIQTTIFESSESDSITFPCQTIGLKESEFPIRVTLYDVDKNRVRFSLGHTFIRPEDATQCASGEAVILTQELCSTICSAKRLHTHSR